MTEPDFATAVALGLLMALLSGVLGAALIIIPHVFF